jgi:hypothetical protein
LVAIAVEILIGSLIDAGLLGFVALVVGVLPFSQVGGPAAQESPVKS